MNNCFLSLLHNQNSINILMKNEKNKKYIYFITVFELSVVIFVKFNLKLFNLIFVVFISQKKKNK